MSALPCLTCHHSSPLRTMIRPGRKQGPINDQPSTKRHLFHRIRVAPRGSTLDLRPRARVGRLLLFSGYRVNHSFQELITCRRGRGERGDILRWCFFNLLVREKSAVKRHVGRGQNCHERERMLVELRRRWVTPA